jgi:uncharacterized protein YjiS (DUF1127 family)
MADIKNIRWNDQSRGVILQSFPRRVPGRPFEAIEGSLARLPMEAEMTTCETYSTSARVVPTRSFAALGAAFLAIVAVRYRVWKNRRAVARLLEWDAHMLADIGLTEGDVYSALATRSDEDASTQLQMRSLERRYAQQAQARDRLSHAALLHVGSAQYRRRS